MEWIQANLLGLIVLVLGIGFIVIPKLKLGSLFSGVTLSSDEEPWQRAARHYDGLLEELEKAGETEAVKNLQEGTWPAIGRLVCKEHDHGEDN